MPIRERVVDRLRRLIEDGSLGASGRLPSERELADLLHVSRGTIREALQFLHAFGLVEIRHGTGTFVRPDATNRRRLRASWYRWTVRNAGRVRELLEVRRALEAVAAESAADALDGHAVAELEEALAQMEAAAQADETAALVHADTRFHHALCQASHNAALADLGDTIADALVKAHAAAWHLAGSSESSLVEHRAIVAALRARDPARARAAVLEHLAAVEDLVDRLATPAAPQPGGGAAPETPETHEERRAV